MNPLLTKSYDAEGTIADHTIVKFGAADNGVLAATAATESLVGVTDAPGDVVSGDRVDVVQGGISDVLYGGTVTRGDLLTADASGRAVTAAPTVGVNNGVIGRAIVSGVVGDIGKVLIVPSQIQGA